MSILQTILGILEVAGIVGLIIFIMVVAHVINEILK